MTRFVTETAKRAYGPQMTVDGIKNMAHGTENMDITFDGGTVSRGFGVSDLVKPLLFGGLAAMAALVSAAHSDWTPAATLVLATVAGINGLFLAAYLQGKSK